MVRGFFPGLQRKVGFQGFSREVNQGSRVFLEDFDVISEDAATIDYFGPQLKVLIQLRLENNWRAGPESNLGQFLFSFFFDENVNQNSRSLSCPGRSDGVSRLIPSRLRSRSTFVLQRSRSKSCSQAPPTILQPRNKFDGHLHARPFSLHSCYLLEIYTILPFMQFHRQ
jgi:hypothetical protein